MTNKILLIGGTGTISLPICELLSNDKNIDLYVLNRGTKLLPNGVTQIVCDMDDYDKLKEVLGAYTFDIVCNFIIYHPYQAQQQLNLFKGRVKQYIFISTVAIYNHELSVMIRENHEQMNKYSTYGQNKAECEKIFLKAYYDDKFPVTIVRPSQTYGFERIPLSVKGNSCWSVIHRILNDQPVIVHGDGKSCWHCTHTNDFAYNFVQLLQNKKAIGNCYQIVNPEVINWDIIYQYIYEKLNKKPRIIHIPSDVLALSKKYDNKKVFLGDKQYSCVYDTEKIEQDILDFRNEIDIFKGVDMYFEYMEKNPQYKKTDSVYDGWCNKMIELYQNYCISILKESL